MSGVSERIATLARIAAALQAETPWRSLPSLWFLTDDERTPDPAAIARRLPQGTAILLRHYRAPDRQALARALAEIAGDRGLKLFVGADAELASAVGAAGVHLPRWARAPAIRPPADWLVTASVHSLAELGARHGVADAFLASPVFATASHEGSAPLGIEGLKTLAGAAGKPVIALGGITARNAEKLLGAGAAGIAAIGEFLDA